MHQKTSSGCRSSAIAPVAWWATTASCTCIAPFGVPVVPLVKCSSASSSGSVGGISKSGSAAASSGAQVGDAGVVERGDLVRGADEQHVREAGQLRRGAPRPCAGRARGVVTSTRASPSASRWRDRLGPEGGEQRAEHRAVLQRAERRDVELRHAPEQRRTRAPRARRRGVASTFAKRAVSSASSRVGDLAPAAVASQPAQRDDVCDAARRRADRPPRGRCSARAARQPVELIARRRPRERLLHRVRAASSSSRRSAAAISRASAVDGVEVDGDRVDPGAHEQLGVLGMDGRRLAADRGAQSERACGGDQLLEVGDARPGRARRTPRRRARSRGRRRAAAA